MRIFSSILTLLILSGFLSVEVSAVNPARRFSKQPVSVTSRKAAKRTAVKALLASNTNTLQFKPAKQTISMWDEYENEWLPVMGVNYTYNDAGLVATETAYYIDEPDILDRVTYEYDENNQKILSFEENSEDNGETWTSTCKYTNTYDPIVTNFKTSTIRYDWYGNWQLTMGTKYLIARNSAEVVTGVERQANLSDTFETIAKITNTIGADNKISSYYYEELQEDYSWEEYLDLRDIKWANTDGQLLAFEVEDFAAGANRIKSASSYYEDVFEGTVTGEYTDDFSGVLTLNLNEIPGEEAMLVIERGYLPEGNGSFFQSRSLTLYEDGEEYAETEYEAYVFDDNGNVISELTRVDYDDETEEFETRYTYTYDETYGVPSETVISFVYFDEEYLDTKIEVNSFVGVASLADISTEDQRINCNFAGRSLNIDAPGRSYTTVMMSNGINVLSGTGEGNYSLNTDGLSAVFYIVRVSTATATKAFKIAIK